MRLVLSRQKITNIADRWASQYPPDKYPDDTRWGQVRQKLAKLDVETATPNDVANIIGNKSWSHVSCSECGDYGDRGVQFGDFGDYSDSVTVCPSCLRAAAALATAAF